MTEEERTAEIEAARAEATVKAIAIERPRLVGIARLGRLGATDAQILAAIESGISVEAFALQIAQNSGVK